MPITDTRADRRSVRKVVMRTALALLVAATAAPSAAMAGETEVKAMLKAMTDFMAAQKELSFRYDASIEAVIKDGEKLEIANSGRVALARPDRIAATRKGGFADIETIFDGKTMTIVGKTKNIYLQVPFIGTVDHLVDVLQNQYNRPLPAADLLLTNAYSELMTDVTEAKISAVASSAARSATIWLVAARRSTCRYGSLKVIDRFRASTSSPPSSSPAIPPTRSSLPTGRPASPT
jgi:hypothetical protein